MPVTVVDLELNAIILVRNIRKVLLHFFRNMAGLFVPSIYWTVNFKGCAGGSFYGEVQVTMFLRWHWIMKLTTRYNSHWICNSESLS